VSDPLEPDVEAAIAADDPEELVGVVIDVALGSRDVEWATRTLARLAAHRHTGVRGQALIAFAHLAGRFEQADRTRIVPILRAACQDPERHVREQAEAALDALGEGGIED
jgi:hypothetical protein